MRDAKKFKLFPVLIALGALMLSVGYIIYRAMDKKRYEQRWQDYDECGLESLN